MLRVNCDDLYKHKIIWKFIQAELADSTGAIWVSFFRQQAQELMGNVTAEQFAQAKENVIDLKSNTHQ